MARPLVHAKLRSESLIRAALVGVLGLVLLSWAPIAAALTSPISGAVPYPASGPKLHLPFPAGSKIRALSGYSPSGGSSLHADTNATSKANDYYALDLVYDDQPNAGKGLPVVAPLSGKVVKAGWATSGWANYGQRVILEHDLGDGHVYHSLYAHLDSIDVTEGNTVSVGQKLGALGQSCQGALSCGSFSTPHLHWALHRDSLIGGSGTGGSYGGNAVVPEPMDGKENIQQGSVWSSTNSSNPVCGDSVCNGTETPATCPGDCKVCAPIPKGGRIVEETESLCFQQAGSPQYWHTEAAGHQNHLFWTTATSDPNPDNYASWDLTFDAAGDYSVEVYTPQSFAQSKQAKYSVVHSGQTQSVVLDQSAKDGWRPLGTFAFAAGGGQSVRLDDNTGEALSMKRQLVIDAIRVSPAGSGGAGGSGGAVASGGGASGQAGAAGAPGGGGAGGGGTSSGSGGSLTSKDEASGCECRANAGASSGSGFAALALLAGLFGARRRRRTTRRER